MTVPVRYWLPSTRVCARRPKHGLHHVTHGSASSRRGQEWSAVRIVDRTPAMARPGAKNLRDNERETIRRMFLAGVLVAEIIRTTGRAETTIFRVVRDLGRKRPTSPPGRFASQRQDHGPRRSRMVARQDLRAVQAPAKPSRRHHRPASAHPRTTPPRDQAGGDCAALPNGDFNRAPDHGQEGRANTRSALAGLGPPAKRSLADRRLWLPKLPHPRAAMFRDEPSEDPAAALRHVDV